MRTTGAGTRLAVAHSRRRNQALQAGGCFERFLNAKPAPAANLPPRLRHRATERGVHYSQHVSTAPAIGQRRTRGHRVVPGGHVLVGASADLRGAARQAPHSARRQLVRAGNQICQGRGRRSRCFRLPLCADMTSGADLEKLLKECGRFRGLVLALQTKCG